MKSSRFLLRGSDVLKGSGGDRERNTSPSTRPRRILGPTSDAGEHSMMSNHSGKWPAGDDLGEFIIRTDTDPRGCVH